MSIESQSKIKVSEIRSNPNNPRNITDDQLSKLKKSITEFPEMLNLRPIVVDEDNMVLGGNMRLQALTELGYEEVPYIKVSDLTDKQKEQFIIKDNVSFGDWNWEQLKTEWDKDLLQDWGMDMLEWDKIEEEKSETEKMLYSKNVEIPIYNPSDMRPEMFTLYDTRKFDLLKRQIDNSNLSDDEKTFLTYAASRHVIFDYEKIADTYAHGDKELQELMEQSALVIIDFNKAIELGYVKIADELTEQFYKDNG
jgi:hypothetical protein